MTNRNSNKATAAEVFGSIKFSGKSEAAPARPWPETGFAANKSMYRGEAFAEEGKLVRSWN